MSAIDKIHEEYTHQIEAIHDELAQVITNYENGEMAEIDLHEIAVWTQNKLAEMLN